MVTINEIFVQNLIAFVLLAGQGVLIFYVTEVGAKIKKKVAVIWLVLIGLTFMSFAEYYLATNYDVYQPARVPLSVACYILRPLAILLFIDLLHEHGMAMYFYWFLLIVDAIIYGTAFFSSYNFAFSYTAENNFVRGPAGYYSIILCIFYLVIGLVDALRYFRNQEKKANAILVFCFLTAVVSGLIDVIGGGTRYATSALLIGCIFYYIYMSIQYNAENSRKQQEALMKSQIQPHFVYNTLTAIHQLCKTDPELAADTVDKFSTYLRTNLDSSTSSSELVPVEKELNHTKLYSDIEMLRFDNIKVIYDIKDKSFSIPFLTIQPMVENAIRHGVRHKRDGLVIVKTFERGSYHVVQIIDNGIGKMDTSVTDLGKHEHIGLKNVRKRIEFICGGNFFMDMEENVGTTITFEIPKKIRERNNYEDISR